MAANWQTIFKGDSGEFKIDKDSIKRKGSLASATLMRNFIYNGEQASMKLMDSIDCSKKQITLVSAVVYKGFNFSGPEIPVKVATIGEPQTPNPGTPAEIEFNLSCPGQSLKAAPTQNSQPTLALNLIDKTNKATIIGSCLGTLQGYLSVVNPQDSFADQVFRRYKSMYDNIDISLFAPASNAYNAAMRNMNEIRIAIMQNGPQSAARQTAVQAVNECAQFLN